jgi:glycosyltransferase involved in cell wall biosynthesis
MKLSVITINLNNAIGLEKTIKSVINQTYKNFEYIIIDGGSVDESIKFIKNNSGKINYWISENDKGIYHAMNKGINKANGEYCLFLNSGDYLYSDSVLSEVFNLNLFEDIIYGKIKMNNNSVIEYSPEHEVSFRYFLKNTLPHPCSLIKRSLLLKVGLFNEINKFVSDWEFFLLAICKHNAKIKRISTIISVYNLNGISSDPKNEKEIKEEKKVVIEKNFQRFLNDYILLDQHENSVNEFKQNFFYRIILKINKTFYNKKNSIIK